MKLFVFMNVGEIRELRDLRDRREVCLAEVSLEVLEDSDAVASPVITRAAALSASGSSAVSARSAVKLVKLDHAVVTGAYQAPLPTRNMGGEP